MESEPMLAPRKKSSLPKGSEQSETAMLHHAGQRAQHITIWAILAPETDSETGGIVFF